MIVNIIIHTLSHLLHNVFANICILPFRCIRNGHGTSVEHFTDYMTRNIGECFRKYNVNAVR